MGSHAVLEGAVEEVLNLNVRGLGHADHSNLIAKGSDDAHEFYEFFWAAVGQPGDLVGAVFAFFFDPEVVGDFVGRLVDVAESEAFSGVALVFVGHLGVGKGYVAVFACRIEA